MRHKEKCCEASFDGRGRVVDEPLILLIYHPVCASKDASRHFLYRRSTPPIQEGKALAPIHHRNSELQCLGGVFGCNF